MQTSIYAYQKTSNAWTEITMRLPDNAGTDDALRATELCTIEGVTYVAVPDALPLPEQPPEIKVERVTLTPELLAAIKAASPHVQLIHERVALRVRQRYTAEQELKLIRLDPCAERDAYVEWAEVCAAWGREQKAALGLVDFDEQKAQALRDVDRLHQQTVLALTGNPTEVERASWPVKLDAARALATGAALPPGADAMLTAMGLTKITDRATWAQKVLTNSARYQTLIGMADKVRAAASARIIAATPKTWAKVSEQNRADMAAALAQAQKALAGGV